MLQNRICLHLNHRPTLTNTKTIILLENFLLSLNNLVCLSTTFSIKRFLNVFII